MSMWIEQEEFTRYVQGDEKAFEGIFRRYYKTLVSFVLRHDVGMMEAEDVVLEVFHHVWEIRREIKSPAILHTLLFTATRNRTLNMVRDIRTHRKILHEHLPREEKEESMPDYVVEEEMSRLLYEAIHKLPGQCREVIVALLAGKSLQEIAGEMEISINTAKTYKLRAINALRESLKGRPLLFLLLLLRLFPKK